MKETAERTSEPRGAAKDAWFFLVCGENERERRFAEGRYL